MSSSVLTAYKLTFSSVGSVETIAAGNTDAKLNYRGIARLGRAPVYPLI
jgi:hypothetical protein